MGPRSTSDPVRVGFIGAGHLATLVHYPSLDELDTASLVAITDIDETRLLSTANRYNVSGRYTNHRDMLDKEHLDAVYVVMPPQLLHDIVIDCLEAGKHVFVEKPPGTGTYQTEAFAWYAAKYGCLTMTGFNRRFVPLLKRCKELVEAAGPIHLAVASFHKQDHDPEDFGFHRGAVSHLTSDVIHAVDALRWIAGGNVKDVAAHARSVDRPYPNTYAALIDFDTGCSGLLVASRRSGARRHHFEFHGGDVAIYSDDQHRAEVFTGEADGPTELLGRDLARSEADHHLFGFFDENQHFIDSIQSGSEPVTNFQDAVQTMRLAEQIASQPR